MNKFDEREENSPFVDSPDKETKFKIFNLPFQIESLNPFNEIPVNDLQTVNGD